MKKFTLWQIMDAIRHTPEAYKADNLIPAFQNFMLELELSAKQNEQKEAAGLAIYLRTNRSIDEIIKYLHFCIPPEDHWINKLMAAGYEVETIISPIKGMTYRVKDQP